MTIRLFSCYVATLVLHVEAVASDKYPDPFDFVPRSKAFDAALLWHEPNSRRSHGLLRLTHFLNGTSSLRISCEVEKQARIVTWGDGTDRTAQYAVWRELYPNESKKLKKLLTEIPPSQRPAGLKDLLIVSFMEQDKWTTRVFDRAKLPASVGAIVQICERDLNPAFRLTARQFVRKEPWVIEVASSKSVYTPFEPIEITITTKYTGKTSGPFLGPDSWPYRIERGFRMKDLTVSYANLRMPVRVTMYGETIRDGIGTFSVGHVTPGFEMSHTLVLNRCYDMTMPGEYVIQATSRLPAPDPPSDQFFSSNELRIRIEEPSTRNETK